MILILVNTFDLNKKESYETDIKTTITTIFGYIKFVWTILEILEVPDQIFLIISVVKIFKFVQ